MKKKGFTLIELLAVIVILAVIALIAIPVIMNIIEKSNKSAFEDSAYGIIEAGELYYSNKLTGVEGGPSDTTFSFPNNIEGLEIKGSKPESGSMKINKEGKIAIAISNGKYCARKGYNDTEVTIDNNLDNCILSSIMKSDNKCIHNTNEICPAGTQVTVKVNNEETKDFYVIKDDGNKLTLIMNKNLGSTVAWYTEPDSSNGPLTVLTELEKRTDGWTNIPAWSFTLKDDKPDGDVSVELYQPIEIENARARLLTYAEAVKLGCKYNATTCPEFLFKNSLVNGGGTGYWLSTAGLWDKEDNAAPTAWRIQISNGFFHRYNIVNNNTFGIRPVIEISKNL